MREAAWFDLSLSLSLVWTVEVGFLTASTSIDAWFVINRLLDVVFILDMALQFCVVFQKASERGNDDASWVTERRKIVRHYFFGWFPLDLFSILPSVFDIIPVVSDASDDSIDKLSGFRAVRRHTDSCTARRLPSFLKPRILPLASPCSLYEMFECAWRALGVLLCRCGRCV